MTKVTAKMGFLKTFKCSVKQAAIGISDGLNAAKNSRRRSTLEQLVWVSEEC